MYSNSTTQKTEANRIKHKKNRLKMLKKPSFEIVVIIFVLLFSIPIYLIIINTFKTHDRILKAPLSLPDFSVGFQNIVEAFQRMDIVKSYLVTFSISAIALVSMIVLSSLAAYAIVRMSGKIFKAAYWVFLSCILMPVQAAFIPLIFILKHFDLYNNIFGISLVYIAILSPFCIFMYSGFIRGIPIELEEAAIMEGCSTLRLFFQIIFPLLKPITATLIIMQFIYIWNDLLLPLVILNGSDYPTVSIGLYKFFGSKGNVDLNLLFGGIALVLLPVVTVFLFLQKYLIKGLASGSIKG
ncbi:carbohydrate ABC transporter permease [Pseudogracilibacillus auburnensis]|uniref:Carbohydrate ABC transporter membrane protein 2 (CUT1 family) n=1 Tax=Pseudogracilibacillus auburnensis TaxID=1494959 RepID=A0A2V3W7N6_9BACI|nr:carbohydrate ABC transporter permease [Pseudogracilibacillus auburnensis]PXW90393.1 carbohydrate ABC transporter membrane protein 2 (CUT1 family) [Pseudogracilibacillus auburnensis]